MASWQRTDTERKLEEARQLGRTVRPEREAAQRELLLGAMRSAAAAEGFEGCRVDDVLERSGLSRSTFYKHFDDKEACFLAAFDASVETLLATIEIRAAGAPGGERYEPAMAGFAKLIVRESGGSETEAPAAAPRFVVGAIASTIAAEVAEGRTAQLKDLMPDLVFTALAPCLGSGQAAKGAQRLAKRAGPRASS